MNRKFQVLPELVQVHLDDGETPEDVVPVLFDAAALAHERQLQKLLVVSGRGDPATAQAVSMALEEMSALGAPPSRIAFVAYQLPQYSVYHFAERYAQKLGIAAKVHISLRDAKEWLGVRQDSRAA